MRVPLSWLKEYISLPLSVSEIEKTLTMAGLEVDGRESIGENLRGIVAAHVREVQKHPDADKLVVALVFDGKETHRVVCGAPNCREGMKTAYAPIGTKIKDAEGEFTIKKAKLRGIESSGMLCSGKELQLSDDADGIMELPDCTVPGTPLSDLYSDTILEISLTPNLNHCASMIGIARELASLTEKPLRLPQISIVESESDIFSSVRAEIVDRSGCPRYSCRLIKNVKIGPSPDWLKRRLEAIGLRSINNVADVTNYVLAETGQPLHAFDYDSIVGGCVVVRKAREGEILTTLDGKERTLNENMLVISDSDKPLALAGIMGGSNSEVGENTCTVLLESAYFDPARIRRASKQVGLSTDASKRFERGSDPRQTLFALDRAAELIRMLAGGDIQKGVLDIKESEFPEKIVGCRLTRINRILGITLSRGEVETIFSNLKFPYVWDEIDRFDVTIPTYRVDITAEIDLIEEVARLYGYDHIPRTGGYFQASSIPSDPLYLFENMVRNKLIGEGLQEFLTCDLIGTSILSAVGDTGMPPEMVVNVLNPVSVEQSVLRTSLLPGLLQVVIHNNAHQIHDIAGFEVGRIHFKDGEQYIEQTLAGIILTGKNRPEHWGLKPEDYDFYDLKGIVENFLREFGIENVEYKNSGLSVFHAGRQASIFSGSLEIGSIGEIHPSVRRRLDLPRRVFFGEINLQDVMKIMKPLQTIKPIPIYPSSERDWTYKIRRDIPISFVFDSIDKHRPALLEEFSLKDLYRSEELGPDEQSITLNFIYRDPLRTIEQEEVKEAHDRLIEEVTRDLVDATGASSL